VLEKDGEDQLGRSCEKNILHKIRLKAPWMGHVYLRNCTLKHINEGNIEVIGVEEGRRRKLLRDDRKETDNIGN
jgi:hypothetical protein